MTVRRILLAVSAAGLVVASLSAAPADAAPPAATELGTPAAILSAPRVVAAGMATPAVGPSGIPTSYSRTWSGYAALPKAAGNTFSAVSGAFTVPTVDCRATPYSFSYHWVGLDGWSNATVEQVGIAADCNGTRLVYAAWYYMYPSRVFLFDFVVHPGDAIEAGVTYLGDARYDLALKDVSTGRSFDVKRSCPVATCENSSAEAITEGYYYDRQYAGLSAYGDEHFTDVAVRDGDGHPGGLVNASWKTGESIAVGRFGAVTSTPGPIATAGLTRPSTQSSAFGVFWARQN